MTTSPAPTPEEIHRRLREALVFADPQGVDAYLREAEFHAQVDGLAMFLANLVPSLVLAAKVRRDGAEAAVAEIKRGFVEGVRR